MSAQVIEIDHFGPGGILDHCRLASYLLRDGELHAYGQDSAISGCSYFYDTLLEWLMVRMNTQLDEGPLEDIPRWLKQSGFPKQALISVGATRYTEFGETHFLKPGDRSIVVVYDQRKWDLTELEAKLLANESVTLEDAAILDQMVNFDGSAR